jgi:hypothetical protein
MGAIKKHKAIFLKFCFTEFVTEACGGIIVLGDKVGY